MKKTQFQILAQLAQEIGEPAPRRLRSREDSKNKDRAKAERRATKQARKRNR